MNLSKNARSSDRWEVDTLKHATAGDDNMLLQNKPLLRKDYSELIILGNSSHNGCS